MFPHTVTIYNKYLDDKTEKWQRTVLGGVLWDSSKGAVMRRTGVTSVDGLALIIPMGILPGYTKPKEWPGLTNRTGRWTIQSGDTVILGNIEYEVMRSSAELKQFDDVITITNVDTKDMGGGMAHFEVSGR